MFLYPFSIGIYPEWNVKSGVVLGIFFTASIGIYPEWNVKYRTYGKYKANKPIGIYPEWNVKYAVLANVIGVDPLEYIQNGM